MLTKEQILQRIKEPKNADSIKAFCEHEEYLRMFAEGSNSELHLSRVAEILDDQKYNNWYKPIFSLSTVKNIYSKIKDTLLRVHSAHGGNTSYAVDNDKDKDKFIEVRNTMFGGISDTSFFKHEGFDRYMITPNAVMCFDRPNIEQDAQQLVLKKGISEEDARNEIANKGQQGVVNIFESSQIKDVECDRYGITYLIVLVRKDDDSYTYCYYDSYKYITIITDIGGRLKNDDSYYEYEHSYGETPCTFFGYKNKVLGNQIIKESPISKIVDFEDSDGTRELSTLDLFLINQTFTQHYKQNSGFAKESRVSPDEATDEEKVKEVLSTMSNGGNYKGRNRNRMGNNVEFPISSILKAESGVVSALLKKPFFRLDADTNVLDFHKKDLADFAQHIYESVCGSDSFSMKGAVQMNEKQVESTLENIITKLNTVSSEVSKVMTFALNISAKVWLRDEVEINGFVFLGDKFYLKSKEKLYAEYESMLKSGGATSQDLQLKRNEIRETTHKNNSKFLARNEIIQNLTLFDNFTKEEVTNIYANQTVITLENYAYWLYFDDLLQEFERGLNGDLVNYKTESPFNVRIESIKKELVNILKTKIDTQEDGGKQRNARNARNEENNNKEESNNT